MKEKDVKLIQMDLIFDVKLNVKKKIQPTQISKSVRKLAMQELIKEIQKTKTNLRRANKKYRQGKIDKSELFDTEWYLYELKQELEVLKGQQPESSDSKTDI
tara:strand:- start:197 stop:502 length:306 start_codon:yes stop_codon:yes gene_type:complete